jgi:hypothetical protein
MAFGSLRECQAIIELEQITNDEVRILGSQLGAILYTLSRKRLTENRTATDADTDAVADN